ncbi:MAG: ATP-binding protein, partial [Bacteroidota bacterium]
NFKDYHLNFLKESSDGSMWVFGSYGLGVVRIKEDTVVQFLHDPDDPNSLGANTVLCMTEGQDGTIWLGTRRKGLNAYRDGRFTRYRSIPDDPETLSNDFVFAIHESGDGRIWVGTEKGLNKLAPATGKFKRYFKKDGLVDDYIASMVTDTHDNLWVGTHSGLVKIDQETDQITNFDMRDGIEVYPFNFNAAHRGRTSGQLFFGGVGGFLAFHPDSIKGYASAPQLQITDLVVSNASAYTVEGGAMSRIEEARRLTFKRGFDKLSLEFSDMAFDFGDRNQFSYRLEGFDHDWNDVGYEQIASYTNLPAGNYTFRVRSSTDGHHWGEPIALEIRILPLWWETFWLRALVGVVLFFALILLVRWRSGMLIHRSRDLELVVAEKTREVESRNKEITKQNEQLTKVIKDLRLTQQQLVESEKMASLGILSAGIGHEINNPLNFIKGGVEGLKRIVQDESDLKTLKKDISDLINIMQDGVDRTARIVRSLSHFSRDNERWNERCNVQMVLENCLIMLSNQLWEKVIVNKRWPLDPVFVIGNEGKLHQAFLNILTNAIQSIQDQGEITILIAQDDREVSVTIIDTGCGIPKENLQRINDPFFTTKEPGKGTGMGLFITYDIIHQHHGQLHCESVVGEGSSFLMTFPVEDLVGEETFVRQ